MSNYPVHGWGNRVMSIEVITGVVTVIKLRRDRSIVNDTALFPLHMLMIMKINVRMVTLMIV